MRQLEQRQLTTNCCVSRLGGVCSSRCRFAHVHATWAHLGITFERKVAPVRLSEPLSSAPIFHQKSCLTLPSQAMGEPLTGGDTMIWWMFGRRRTTERQSEPCSRRPKDGGGGDAQPGDPTYVAKSHHPLCQRTCLLVQNSLSSRKIRATRASSTFSETWSNRSQWS